MQFTGPLLPTSGLSDIDHGPSGFASDYSSKEMNNKDFSSHMEDQRARRSSRDEALNSADARAADSRAQKHDSADEPKPVRADRGGAFTSSSAEDDGKLLPDPGQVLPPEGIDKASTSGEGMSSVEAPAVLQPLAVSLADGQSPNDSLPAAPLKGSAGVNQSGLAEGFSNAGSTLAHGHNPVPDPLSAASLHGAQPLGHQREAMTAPQSKGQMISTTLGSAPVAGQAVAAPATHAVFAPGVGARSTHAGSTNKGVATLAPNVLDAMGTTSSTTSTGAQGQSNPGGLSGMGMGIPPAGSEDGSLTPRLNARFFSPVGQPQSSAKPVGVNRSSASLATNLPVDANWLGEAMLSADGRAGRQMNTLLGTRLPDVALAGDGVASQPASHLASAIDVGQANTGEWRLAASPLESRTLPAQQLIPVPVGRPGWSEAVADRVMWLSVQNAGKAELALDPPELGPLQVRINTQGEHTSISFNVSHSATREALDQSLTRLREMMSEQGFAQLDVDVSGGEPWREAEGEAAAEQDALGAAEETELTTTDDAIATRQGAEVTAAPLSQGLVDHYV